MLVLHDYNAYQLGIPLGVHWTPSPTNPVHWLVVGPSGTGKTWVSASICARVCLHIENSRLYIADYKGDDFFERVRGDMPPEARYWRFNHAVDGVRAFYAILERRLAGDPDRTLALLWVDELAAMLTALPRKESEEVRNMVGVILQTGRSMNCQLMVSVQRPDSQHFNAGARESIGMSLYLGSKMSPEAATMMGFDRKTLPPIQGRAGYLTVNGSEPRAVQVITIRDTTKLVAALQAGITR